MWTFMTVTNVNHAHSLQLQKRQLSLLLASEDSWITYVHKITLAASIQSCESVFTPLMTSHILFPKKHDKDENPSSPKNHQKLENIFILQKWQCQKAHLLDPLNLLKAYLQPLYLDLNSSTAWKLICMQSIIFL